ncbi:PREDICTED: cadherin-related family member 1-like [Branchiostoma belcheri]|uniref:Cadherin-related family member 1-like n=1 Tax=Branchiostoma belcheri TaxID=7741 RepID=A0A6P4ZPD1_BRABE|nr:PREDICTED: cadherin-related family member 1-like [Branchiostoma belcheri]
MRTADVLWTLILFSFISKGRTNMPPYFSPYVPGTDRGNMQHLAIREDTPVGTVVYTLHGSDPEGQTVYYGIEGDIGREHFTVDRLSGTVTLKEAFDRELGAEHDVVVTIEDSTPANKVRQSSKIFVTDTNDETPVFKNLPYRVQIPENSPVGTFVVRVSAEDRDLGLAGTVHYRIQESEGSSNFSIDTVRGVITLATTLDYEKKTSYQVTVMARDEGGFYRDQKVYRNSTAVVDVEVLDQQDMDPVFYGQPYRVNITEDTPVGSSIAVVSAVDGDRGTPNDIQYSVTCDAGPLFDIDPHTGVIRVNQSLDRDDPTIGDVLTLDVKAMEIGPGAGLDICTHASVTVRLLDVNDDSPTFYEGEVPQAVFNTSIPEDAEGGTYLTQLNIVIMDRDEGNNAVFGIDLLPVVGPEEDIFDVDPKFAANIVHLAVRLKSTASLDREKTSNYTYMVFAHETSTLERHNGSALLVVQLEDVNDCPPVFNSSRLEVSVPEDVGVGETITTVVATDGDEEGTPNSEIRYSIVTGNDDDLFALDETTGVLTWNMPVDYESIDQSDRGAFTLEVQAQDQGQPPLSSTVEVVITVEYLGEQRICDCVSTVAWSTPPPVSHKDVNDNAPACPHLYNFTVTQNVIPGSYVGRVAAVDLDEGDTQRITYELPQNLKNKFAIDQATGGLFVASGPSATFDNEAEGQVYDLVVYANDNGVPPQIGICRVKVKITRAQSTPGNGERPMFTEESVYLTCAGDYVMKVEIAKSGASGNTEGRTLHIGDSTASDCLATENSTHYVLTTRVDECGTTKTIHSGNRVIYSNTVDFIPVPDEDTSNMTALALAMRQYAVVKVVCMYTARGVASTHFSPERDPTIVKVADGEMAYHLDLYPDEQFTTPFKVYPIDVSMGESMYFEVGLDSPDLALIVFAENCWASTSPSGSTANAHWIIRDGCVVDESLQVLPSDQRRFRFTLAAFELLQSNPWVYVYCEVVVCNMTELNSRCHQGCISQATESPPSEDDNFRRKRSDGADGIRSSGEFSRTSLGRWRNTRDSVVRRLHEVARQRRASSANLITLTTPGPISGYLACGKNCGNERETTAMSQVGTERWVLYGTVLVVALMVCITVLISVALIQRRLSNSTR